MYLNRLEIMLMAIALDLAVGDPRVSWHPVALVGRLIAWWERLFYRDGCSPCRQMVAGVVFALMSIISVLLVVWVALRLCNRSLLCQGIISVVLLWSTIAARSLHRAAAEIEESLSQENLSEARTRVGMIVGRDTAGLDEPEITRATVETVAENLSDGVIAPLFYFVIGGVPLACLYRVINTLDSMVGYRNQRYRYFGWFSARLDDVANFLPARLTTLLIFISALLSRRDWRRAIRVVGRDSRKHPSPNSGYPEAAVAGALRVRLGGTNYYGGVPSHRPTLGDPVEPLSRVHLRSAVNLLYWSLAVFTAIYVALFLIWKWGWGL